MSLAARMGTGVTGDMVIGASGGGRDGDDGGVPRGGGSSVSTVSSYSPGSAGDGDAVGGGAGGVGAGGCGAGGCVSMTRSASGSSPTARHSPVGAVDCLVSTRNR